MMNISIRVTLDSGNFLRMFPEFPSLHLILKVAFWASKYLFFPVCSWETFFNSEQAKNPIKGNWSGAPKVGFSPV